jgi:hypothetical protein
VKLFLWKLKQEVNNDYDTYGSAVVVSSNPVSAKRIHPGVDSQTGKRMSRYVEGLGWCWDNEPSGTIELYGIASWADPKDVHVTCIGEASDWLGEGAVVCSSFHAG